jgi:hypothetical protein
MTEPQPPSTIAGHGCDLHVLLIVDPLDGRQQPMTGTWLIAGFEPILKVANVTREDSWTGPSPFGELQ